MDKRKYLKKLQDKLSRELLMYKNKTKRSYSALAIEMEVGKTSLTNLVSNTKFNPKLGTLISMANAMELDLIELLKEVNCNL